jgi:hypothetical protein
MKRPTPISTEGSRQIDIAFDTRLTHGLSPQQREAAVAALAGLLAEAAGTGGKETRNERA